MKRSFQQAGVSLVELLVVIMTVGMLVVLLANLPPSINLISRSNHQSIANQIVNKKVEELRATPYANLATGDSTLVDGRLSLLPNSSGTVSVSDCSPTICTSGEVMKQLTITVTWKDNNKTQKVELKTLITDGGLK